MITNRIFGKMPSGETVTAYTISAGKASVTILDMGGIVASLMLPDKNGNVADVVCGFDTVEGYLTGGGYHGSIVGRYANRIHEGHAVIAGKEYHLVKNDGINHLHGGTVGFNQKIWSVKPVGGDTLVLHYVSADGEEGYPGCLDVTVTYVFTGEHLSIHYEATTDKETLCNLTNHSYFNLSGYASCDIGKHIIRVPADEYTAVDDNFIVIGNRPVEGIFDLREPVAMTAELDHNFMLGESGTRRLSAEVYDTASGRVMTQYTDMPSMQIYTANMMNDPVAFKGGVAQTPHTAFCLETQFPPDSPNHPDFPQATLRPGEKYDHTTEFFFGVK